MLLDWLTKDPDIFPKFILILYFCSCFRYAAADNWWKALYWFSAALITISVTFAPTPK